jgi:hypothetical protein
MQELEITWERLASIWWLVMWRGMIGGAAFGACVTFVIALPAVFSPNFPLSPFVTIAGIVGPAATLLVAWPVVIRMALTKNYQGFRIVLIPSATPSI